jgi:spore coat protein CotH
MRFRGSYGRERLEYDLFGGGVTSFSNLLLRSGQDQSNTIVRNEACYALTSEFTNTVPTERFQYCVVYLNGIYSGIYALMEKPNEDFYGTRLRIDGDDVEMEEASVFHGSLYADIFSHIYDNSMGKEGFYQYAAQFLDMDSLIDWMFFEGYFANSDLTYGNLKFCRSNEGDTRWKFIFYDLDSAMGDPSLIQLLFLRPQSRCYQVNQMVMKLLKNQEFKDRFLKRAAELLRGPLSEETVLEEIERLAKQVEPEVERDRKNTPQTYRSWKSYIQTLKDNFTEKGWNQKNIKAICKYLNLTKEERAYYFG